MTMIETTETLRAEPDRPLGVAIARGASRRCPNCGDGALFNGFLKVSDGCSVCGEELRHHRADDLPAFLSILISGKIMVALLVFSETVAPLGDSGYYIWPMLALVMSVGLISPIKGAVVGVQWANRMHGFGEEPETFHDPSTVQDEPRSA